MKVYHGSDRFIPHPSLEYSRIDTDFGRGFYVTEDYEMAEKWACRRSKAIITEYDFNLAELDFYEFSLDLEWLEFVISNRNMEIPSFNPDKFDVLIGATADDKLFATIEQFEEGLLPVKVAIEAINCMKVGIQYCLKTNKALLSLRNPKEIILTPEQLQSIRVQNRKDRETANKLTKDILKKHFQKGR